jgi:hypothetical protein
MGRMSEITDTTCRRFDYSVAFTRRTTTPRQKEVARLGGGGDAARERIIELVTE